MGSGHSHANVAEGHESKLWIVLALTTTFLIAEVVGGILTKSLAPLSDAAGFIALREPPRVRS